jgi:hypothetical protein
MVTKLALLVLAAVILAGAVSRWRKPPGTSSGNKIEAARKCPDCGAYLIGSGPCPCADGSGR